MEYLIEQMFIYLLTAFALGLIVGWFICSQGMKKRIVALEAQLVGDTPGTPVDKIEGIGEGFSRRLHADGIDTTEKLLEHCTNEDGIAKVCQCVDLDADTVRNWGTMADLMRIKGLGGQWAELMWRAGVTSVQDLAGRDVGPLRARFREVNEAEHRVAELPGESRVTKFIEQAKGLESVLPDRP